MRAVLRAASSLAQNAWGSSVSAGSSACSTKPWVRFIAAWKVCFPWLAESPLHQCRVIRGQLSPRHWHQGREGWCVRVQSAGLLVVAVSDDVADCGMRSCCAECSCWRHIVYCGGSRCIVGFCRWCGVSLVFFFNIFYFLYYFLVVLMYKRRRFRLCAIRL